TAEENVEAGGFGSACLECLVGEAVSVLVCALPNDYLKQGPTPLLLDEYGLSPRRLAERALKKWWPERL
ncbi:MAG: 1-deoxy-D-xylulose-5-phosphate synthase, partial [Clostridiales bacterium]|nr:1-deoxy-D-xylulose-5-phosphate synthase [Clostridiales bacterium]